MSKQTYVDKIFSDAKKPERVVPAPNTYSPNRDNFLNKPMSQKWSNEKRNSFIDKIMKAEKLTVSPNAYNPQQSDKITGVYLGQ
jgi:hypothetical protein